MIRFGYNFLRHDELPQESVFDSSIGISRSTADQYPGLPLIVLGRDEGGGAIGTSDVTYRGYVPSLSFADAITMQRGQHSLRLGGELIHSEWRARAAIFSYGEIDFPTFAILAFPLLMETAASLILALGSRIATSYH